MKKICLSLTIIGGMLLNSSCATKQKVTEAPQLFEMLTQQNDGGANIKFYEILTESNEIAMLQNDEHLRNKIKSTDIDTSNFIILNMGEKPTGGYSVAVDAVTELDNMVIVSVKESGPEPGAMVTQAISYPYAIVKINSKKQIVIK